MALTKPRAYQIYDIDYKQAVRVVSTSNVTLSGGAPNSVDGVNLSSNNRVLVTGQTNKAQNGIYYVTTVGSGSNGTWARTNDADLTGEVLAGMIVMATEGSQYADTQWKLLTDDPITIGVTELTFAQNYGVPYTAASIPPTANVVVGSQWFDTDTNVLYEYMYDGTSYYWIDITGPAIGTNGVMEGSVLANGNSNVNVSFNGNITATVSNTNIVTWAPTGQYTTGLISATGNITGGNLSTGGLISATGAIYSNYNTNTANVGSFMATGGNTKGGTGYLDFLVAQNTSGGATNPYKWMRTTSDGQFQIINSAYTQNIFNLTDTGNVTIPGQLFINGAQTTNGPAFSAYAAAVLQTIPNNAQTKVLFQTEEFDTDNCYTNSRFTPTAAGYYQLNAEVRLDGTSGTGEMMIILYKNGSEYKRGTNQSGTQIASNFWAMQVSSVAYANGLGDYFEIYVQQGSGGDRTVTAVNNTAITWFNGCMVRGA